MFHIAAFGKISVGKSALLNSLFSVEVFTVDARGGSTLQAHTHKVKFCGQQIRITDTPGFGEVGGDDRAEEARRVARKADLVLAVFDHDLTDMEMREVEALAKYGKPMLGVLNKADALGNNAIRRELRELLSQRLCGCVENENVFVCAASPVRRFIRDDQDGNSVEWETKGSPDIEELRERVFNVLNNESALLRKLNKIARNIPKEEARKNDRRRAAAELIDQYAIGAAFGIAANPIPLLDVFGGGAALAVLVNQLGDCHSNPVTSSEAASLSSQLFSEGWSLLWPSLIPILGGTLVKSIPFLGWFAGAALQGAAAYYIIHVLGNAASSYLEQEKNRRGSLRASLEQIIAQTDRKSVMRVAQDRIKSRMG